jgi:hypothetical protein
VVAESDRYIALDLGLVQKANVPTDRLPRLSAKASGSTAGVPDCGTTTAYNVERIGQSSAPFAGPPVKVAPSAQFSVVGWAVDKPNGAAAGDVDVMVGDIAHSASYGADRPDVAAYLGSSTYRASEFIVQLDGDSVGSGSRALSLRILAADRSCYYRTPAIEVSAR